MGPSSRHRGERSQPLTESTPRRSTRTHTHTHTDVHTHMHRYGRVIGGLPFVPSRANAWLACWRAGEPGPGRACPCIYCPVGRWAAGSELLCPCLSVHLQTADRVCSATNEQLAQPSAAKRCRRGVVAGLAALLHAAQSPTVVVRGPRHQGAPLLSVCVGLRSHRQTQALALGPAPACPSSPSKVHAYTKRANRQLCRLCHTAVFNFAAKTAVFVPVRAHASCMRPRRRQPGSGDGGGSQ